MPNEPELSVLVVAFRNPELTVACLESIYAATTATSFEVLVHDNQSGDGTAEAVATRCPQVDLSRDQGNLGFARANNLLAARARGEMFLLLNPDTIVHPGSLDRMVVAARQHPEAVPLGGRTLRPNGDVDPSSCWGAMTVRSLACFATGASTVAAGSSLLDPESLGGWARNTWREVGIVTGCLALLPRAAWERLGGFDETFWMYGEDADLSMRARALGYRPAITPDAEITHVVGASSAAPGRKRVLVLRSKATLIRKHWRPGARGLGLMLLQAGVLLRALPSLARGSIVTEDEPWPYAWSRRREWRAGFAPVSPAERGP